MTEKDFTDFFKKKEGIYVVIGIALGFIIATFLVPILILGGIGLVAWWYLKKQKEAKK